jgi:N-acetylgalactosamine-6-sulfatase
MKQFEQMSRRHFLSAIATGATLSVLPKYNLASAFPPTSQKPNIIFILADDMGWGDPDCYGHEHIKTPNLDMLAKQGSLFTQFYVNAACCSPSRTAFLTGSFPAKYGVNSGISNTEKVNKHYGTVNFLDPQVPTVTKLMKKADYVTGHFGKWHLGFKPLDRPDITPPELSEYGIDEHRIFNGYGKQFKQKNFHVNSSEYIIDESINFIEKNKNKSFYLNVWLREPHAMLDPTEKQMEYYKHLGPTGNLAQKYKGAMQIYYATITNLDFHIGRLLKKLDDLGLSNDTIIVFSSDNGPEDIHIPTASYSAAGSAGPFRGRKGSFYEGGIRMPFIVRWPGKIPAGKVNDETVISGVDLLPTLCDFAGVELPANFELDGENMSNAVLGKSQKRTKALMWACHYPRGRSFINRSPMLAVREGKWKFHMNPDQTRVELYDVLADPTEVDNLADQNPNIVKKLSEALLEWQKTVTKGNFIAGAGSNEYPWPKKTQ